MLVTLGTSASFSEVPEDLLKGGNWVVVQSRRWEFQENILATEARALVWAIRRLCRSTKFHNVRLLFLVDNLPLVLAMTKGRAASQLLTTPLRQICALSIASGSPFVSRWIASERNPADKPSRVIRPTLPRAHHGKAKERPSSQARNEDDEVDEAGEEVDDINEVDEGDEDFVADEVNEANEVKRSDEVKVFDEVDEADEVKAGDEVNEVQVGASTGNTFDDSSPPESSLGKGHGSTGIRFGCEQAQLTTLRGGDLADDQLRCGVTSSAGQYTTLRGGDLAGCQLRHGDLSSAGQYATLRGGHLARHQLRSGSRSGTNTLADSPDEPVWIIPIAPCGWVRPGSDAGKQRGSTGTHGGSRGDGDLACEHGIYAGVNPAADHALPSRLHRSPVQVRHGALGQFEGLDSRADYDPSGEQSPSPWVKGIKGPDRTPIGTLP